MAYKASWLTLLLLLSIQGLTLGQRVKYKDLFVLLKSKQYGKSEPFLKTFLSDDKNADHANAHLQMGYIYAHKMKKQDVILETEQLNTYGDSA
ncbi:MAG: hypothetical protein AAFX87_26440, partial [Bacteroidota bacterium]